MKPTDVRIALLAAALALLGLVSPVLAQEDVAPIFDDETIAEVPIEDKLVDAQERIKLMRDTLDEVDELLERARADELDFQKINCINAKRILVKGQLKVAEQAYVELIRARDTADPGAQIHNYKLILIASDQINRLGGEASLCIGETTQLAEGENETELDIADGIADVVPVSAAGTTTLDPSVDDLVMPQSIPELTPIQ